MATCCIRKSLTTRLGRAQQWLSRMGLGLIYQVLYVHAKRQTRFLKHLRALVRVNGFGEPLDIVRGFLRALLF